MDIIFKTCTKCKTPKPITEFYRSKNSPDGRYPSCKECKYTATRKWVEKNKEHVRKYRKEWRAQNKDRWKGYSARYYENNRDKVLEKQEQYRQENGDEINRRNRRYYWRTRPKQLKRSKDYKRRNRSAVRKRGREYARKNKDKIRRYRREWERNNPEKIRAKNERRRARAYAAPGDFTAEQFVELCKRYDGCCLACGSRENVTADHVIPLSRGGSNYIENIQPLCLTCNASKGTKTTDYRPHADKVKRWKQPALPLD